MEHFKYFPSIEYSNNTAVNIMVRGKIRDAVLAKQGVYYKHTIRDVDRPDILATKYYGNPKHTWVLYYANNIFDPRHDWPLTSEEFSKYIKDKYGSIQAAYQNIHHYLLDNTYIIDKETYLDGNINFNRKKVITNYDYELIENEKKRELLVLDVVFLRQITAELINLFE